MTPSQFKVGDVVQLPSGSQRMTITAVYEDEDGDPSVEVSYMVYGSGKLKTAVLPIAALRLVTP